MRRLLLAPLLLSMAGSSSDVQVPPPGVLRIIVVDDNGQPLTARVRINNAQAPWSAGPTLQTTAPHDRSTLLAVRGRAQVTLAPGDYLVVATHGPEWSIDEQRVTVRAGERTSQMRAVLQREVDAGAFTACDLHVHTEVSPDSELRKAERSWALRAEDVHFAVATDHNRIGRLPDLDHQLASVPGVEVTTWRPEIGHFNVFPLRRAPEYRGRAAGELFDELHANPDVLVQVNHPRLLDHIGYFTLHNGDAPTNYDLLEVYNGFDLGKPEAVLSVLHHWLELLSRGMRITATGNSDSHHLARQWSGYPRTYVQVPREAVEVDAVLRALRAGRAYVSNGPRLELRVHGSAPGETARVTSDTVDVWLVADGPSWMDLDEITLWAGTERVRTIALSPWPSAQPKQPYQLRFAQQVRLKLPKDASFVVATVRGDRPMERLLPKRQAAPLAFTNPVWLDRTR